MIITPFLHNQPLTFVLLVSKQTIFVTKVKPRDLKNVKIAEQQRALGPYKYLRLKYPFAELNISAVEGSLNLITSAPQAYWCSCFEHRQEQHFYCVICTSKHPAHLQSGLYSSNAMSLLFNFYDSIQTPQLCSFLILNTDPSQDSCLGFLFFFINKEGKKNLLKPASATRCLVENPF